ncbi:MAG: hypothetical protein JWN03_6666 [Nocardia sp.]|nr:hypothetical protein [Nocardia sp.]
MGVEFDTVQDPGGFVVLILNADRSLPSATEEQVVKWMRTWQGQHLIPGVAISGCFIPDRKNPDRAIEADLVMSSVFGAPDVAVGLTISPEGVSNLVPLRLCPVCIPLGSGDAGVAEQPRDLVDRDPMLQ